MALRGHYVELFTPEWVNALKGTPESGMAATIAIYDPETIPYNPVTKKYDGIPIYIYEGKARVQPIRAESERYQVGNSTSIQNVRVSIPIDAIEIDLTTAHRVQVLDSSLNPLLLEYEYVVSKIMDSSNPIEKTFQCTVNQEIRFG